MTRQKEIAFEVILATLMVLSGCRGVLLKVTTQESPTPISYPTLLPRSTDTITSTETACPEVTVSQEPTAELTVESAQESKPEVLEILDGTRENIDNWVNGKTLYQPLTVSEPGWGRDLGKIVIKNEIPGAFSNSLSGYMGQGVYLGGIRVLTDFPKTITPNYQGYKLPSYYNRELSGQLKILSDRVNEEFKDGRKINYEIAFIGIEHRTVVPVIVGGDFVSLDGSMELVFTTRVGNLPWGNRFFTLKELKGTVLFDSPYVLTPGSNHAGVPAKDYIEGDPLDYLQQNQVFVYGTNPSPESFLYGLISELSIKPRGLRVDIYLLSQIDGGQTNTLAFGNENYELMDGIGLSVSSLDQFILEMDEGRIDPNLLPKISNIFASPIKLQP